MANKKLKIIKAITQDLKIPYLLHFTRLENLPSILEHGLYPVGQVHTIGVSPQINDTWRLDGYRDSTSVSITFPNCLMFYRLRMENADAEWVVLILNPSILWEKRCAFCKHNAADSHITIVPLDTLVTPQSFLEMFEEIEGMPSREEQKLKSFDPTDVQAEVLVFGVIEPEYIAAVCFESKKARDTYSPCLGGRKAYRHAPNKGVFASRNYVRLYS